MPENDEKSKSLGLKIGHAIRKCCSLAKCQRIKDGKEYKRSEIDDFITLPDEEWNDHPCKVSCLYYELFASCRMVSSYLFHDSVLGSNQNYEDYWPRGKSILTHTKLISGYIDG